MIQSFARTLYTVQFVKGLSTLYNVHILYTSVQYTVSGLTETHLWKQKNRDFGCVSPFVGGHQVSNLAVEY